MAIVCDVRGGEYFAELERVLDELGTSAAWSTRSCSSRPPTTCWCARFKETRRRHPLAAHDSVLDGIRRERALLDALRERANHIIDTSGITIQELKLWLNEEIIHRGQRQSITFSFVSFGYKYGIPIDADLLFDVRFLPNPFYDLDLRPLTGLDQAVRDYVLGSVDGAEFFGALLPLLDYLFPRYVAEGKAHLTIGVGCTGGRHRSVTIAQHWLADHYAAAGVSDHVRHRDMTRGLTPGPRRDAAPVPPAAAAVALSGSRHEAPRAGRLAPAARCSAWRRWFAARHAGVAAAGVTTSAAPGSRGHVWVGRGARGGLAWSPAWPCWCWALAASTGSREPPASRACLPLRSDLRLARGPRIVAIGGGTGLAALLSGLKLYTSNLTAVVTVADDGGSSGPAARGMGVLPPGDIRNCLVALADDESRS